MGFPVTSISDHDEIGIAASLISIVVNVYPEKDMK